ncbi:MAG: hypothetical protein WBQ72_17815, partial [Terriglobales bacterium]
LGMELASALHELYPADFKLERMADLVMNRAVMQAIEKEEDPRRIAEEWREGLESFLVVRGKYLVY